MESFYIFPQFISTLAYIDSNDRFQSLFITWGALIGISIIYLVILRLFILKSDWIIDKLKLNRSFQENRININIQPKSLISIAVIIIGGIVLVENFPLLIKQIFEFFQQDDLFKDYKYSSWTVFYFVKTIIGFLMVSNSKFIVGFIESQNKD